MRPKPIERFNQNCISLLACQIILSYARCLFTKSKTYMQCTHFIAHSDKRPKTDRKEKFKWHATTMELLLLCSRGERRELINTHSQLTRTHARAHSPNDSSCRRDIMWPILHFSAIKYKTDASTNRKPCTASIHISRWQRQTERSALFHLSFIHFSNRVYVCRWWSLREN